MDDEHHKPVTLPTVAGPFRVRFVPCGPLPPRRHEFDDDDDEPDEPPGLAARLLDLEHIAASAAERLMLALGEPVPTTLHTNGRPRYVIGTAASLPAVVDRVVREVLDLRAKVREAEVTT